MQGLMQVLSVRMTAEDKEDIRVSAEAADMSVSQYVRYCALERMQWGSEQLATILIELLRNREMLLAMRVGDATHNAALRGRVEAIPREVLLARAMELRKRTA
jgi:hypothetical protein